MILQKDQPKAFDETLSVLEHGGIVILPCDTIYGIVGIAPDTDTRIRNIKGRGETKPFLELIRDFETLKEISSAVIDRRLLEFWPGALTMIVKRRGGGTVAVRVPQDDFLMRLLSSLKRPLYSTSVNKSGEQPLWKIVEIIETFQIDVDLIVSDGDLPGKLPSTIIDVSERPYKVVRQGAVDITDDLLS